MHVVTDNYVYLSIIPTISEIYREGNSIVYTHKARFI